MWFGNVDSLVYRIVREPDIFHVLPDSPEGRQAVQRITDLVDGAFCMAVDSSIYVALNVKARDQLLDKFVFMYDRKMQKLKAMQKEVEELRESLEVLMY